MATDLLDSFHEELCKLHLYEDIIDQQIESRAETKTKFYGSQEYINYHRQTIVCEAKTLLKKISSQNIPKCCLYRLAHRQRLRNFFVLDFHQVETHDLPPIRQFDLVLVFNQNDPEQNHMIAVVDTSNESLLIVKIVL